MSSGLKASDSAHPAALDGTGSEAPSLWGYPATYLLIGINLAVYGAMYRLGPLPVMLRGVVHSWHLAGAARTAPETQFRALADQIGGLLTAPFSERVLLVFGSSSADLTLFRAQWWRLITANFVHVHLLHLLLNMWCLWNLGLFGEPLLGPAGLVAVYLLTGAAGMFQSLLVSLYVGRLDIVAGASGAVFGLAGILIVLLSNRKLALPWRELRSLRLQVIFFAAANLLIGLLPQILSALSPHHHGMAQAQADALTRVDNGAHFGGLLCGLALGFPLFPRLTSTSSSYHARQMMVFGTAALLLMLAGYALASFARSLGAV